MQKKSVFICIFILLILSACSLSQKERQNGGNTNFENSGDTEINTEGTEIKRAPSGIITPTITPVYVTINSHAESSITINTKQKYLQYRNDLLERLQLIQSYNAKLNWESDYSVLLAMQEYETSDLYANTNNKNILTYMIEDLDFSVDPHLHPSDYNYADLAYLIEQLGVHPSGVIGGLIVFECVHGEPQPLDWHDTLELESDGYVHGKKYPSYKWKPEILSGAGSSGHVYDELSSGMWYAGNEESFYDDQGEGIVLFGQGYDRDATLIEESKGETLYYEDGGYIKELVGKIKSGELPAGKMYTANLHVQDTAEIGKSGVGTNDALQQVLEELKPYADAGYIKYVTYQEGVDIWKDQYDSVPNKVDITSFTQYENIKAQEDSHC